MDAPLEAKKHALRQNQEGAFVLSLNIHPQDNLPAWLLTAPMGQRLYVRIENADDETSPRSAHNPDAPRETGKRLERNHAEANATATGRGAAPGLAKRKWSSMKWVERFGILCEDPQFQNFAWDFAGNPYSTYPDGPSEIVAQIVRDYCGVKSRKDIDGNPEAEKRAAVLMAEWDAYQGKTRRPE